MPDAAATPGRDCPRCPRLVEFRKKWRNQEPGWFNAPVPSFGSANARLLIVGLAPGLQGANRTGRPFTGDYAGVLLYETLHAFGYANRPVSVAAGDGLVLGGCRISNAVKCVPPENKPETGEIRRCNAYLKDELAALPANAALLALGLVAHKAVLLALGLKQSAHPFAHGAVHRLPAPERISGDLDAAVAQSSRMLRGSVRGAFRLYDSYHCSRYNTQTNRLTPEMFRAVFQRIQEDSPCP
jgi:uracil-DNA glycosylase family 4